MLHRQLTCQTVAAPAEASHSAANDEMMILRQAAGRNGYLAVLKQLAEQHKSRPFGYLWAEGGAQKDLETSLGIGGCPPLSAAQPTHP